MELKTLFKSYCETLNKEYCYNVWYMPLHNKCYSKPVVMPIDIQNIIGKALFSYAESHEYYGIKSGDYKTIQCFSLNFTEDYNKFYIHFYLPLKQNWEEYDFELKDNKLECTKYPIHIEKRKMPDISLITECVIKTIKMHLEK